MGVKSWGECGHLLGHLAVPNKDGVLTYLPVRCNWSVPRIQHEHAYNDPQSGLKVHRFTSTRVGVDKRGCVVQAW